MSTFHEIIGEIISGTTYLMQVHKENRGLQERTKVLSTRETLNNLRVSFEALIEAAAESKRRSHKHYFAKSKQARERMDRLSKRIGARDALRAEMHGADLGVHMMKGVDHSTLTQFTLDQSFGFANVFTEMSDWLKESRREYEDAVRRCDGMRVEIDGLVEETERADEEYQRKNGEWMMLVQQMEIFGPFMRYALDNVAGVLETEEAEDVFELEAIESPSSPVPAKNNTRKPTYVPFRPIHADLLEALKSPSTPPITSHGKKKQSYTPYRATATHEKQTPRYFTNRPPQRDPLRKMSLAEAEAQRRASEKENAKLLYNEQIDAMEAAHKAIAATQGQGRIVSGDGRVGFRGGQSSEMGMWF